MIERSRELFFCCGAARAGTTWLHKRLCEIEELSLPDDKEIHYYSGLYSEKYVLPPERRRFGIPNNVTLNSKLSGVVLKHLGGARNLRRLALRAGPNLRWYKSNFNENRYKWVDITPAYAVCTSEAFRRMKLDFPGSKVMLVLRDPAERHLSHLKYYIKNRNISCENLTLDYACQPFFKERSNYAETIARISEHFDRKDIGVFFYDNLEDDPRAFLETITDFMGVDRQTASADTTSERINTSEKFEIPDLVSSTITSLWENTTTPLSTVRPYGRIPAWVNE